MKFRTRSFALIVATAAGMSTAAFADPGVSDNTNAIINGDTNRPAERVMDRDTANSALTGAGRGDNTNAVIANPNDLMRQPTHRNSYYAPAPVAPPDRSLGAAAVPVVPPDAAPVTSDDGTPVTRGTYGPNRTRY